MPAEIIDSYPSMELIQAITQKTGSVKLFSDAAARSLELIIQPDTTVEALSRALQDDAELECDILSIVQGAIYSTGSATTDLDCVIANHGLRPFKNLIIASSIAGSIRSLEIHDAEIQETIWKHSILTGVMATHLNRTLQLGFEGEEFTAGIAHDWGRLLVAAVFPSSFAQFDPLGFNESSSVLIHEDEILGSNHCDLGCWFAAQQGLPEEFCNVIRYHHCLNLFNRDVRLVALIATADHMANHYQRTSESRGYEPTGNLGIEALAQCGSPLVVAQFNEIANGIYADAIEDAESLASFS